MATIYASPTGLDGNPGTLANPVSLPFASALTSPGTTVYLLDGTYNVSSDMYMAVAGTLNNPIVYRSLNGLGAVTINCTGGPTTNGFRVYDITIGYYEFRDMIFEGNNGCNAAVKADNHGHHVLVQNCIVKNFASDGLTANDHADYISFVGNWIHHTGYNVTLGSSWGSGITINHNLEGLTGWFDSYPGFHSFVVGNVISGSTDESVHHTDGNGIIMDSGGNTPPCLIANNVVYGNGGSGILCLDSQNHWIVHNTCYNNLLDDRVNVPFSSGQIAGNMVTSTNNQWINNIAYSWGSDRYAFCLMNNATATPYTNGYFGGITAGGGISAPDLANIAKFIHADPLFVSAPAPLGANNQTNALAPWLLGTGLQLQGGSPFISAGINPWTAAGLTPDLQTGFDRYVRTDINGVTRGLPNYDLGAYCSNIFSSTYVNVANPRADGFFTRRG